MKDLVGVARDVRVCSGAGGAAVTVGVGAIWTGLGAGLVVVTTGGADVVVVMVAADGGSPAMLNTCADVDVVVDLSTDVPTCLTGGVGDAITCATAAMPSSASAAPSAARSTRLCVVDMPVAVRFSTESGRRQRGGGLAEHLISQPRRRGQRHRHSAEQCGRIDHSAALGLAGRTVVDVACDAFAHQHGEHAVPRLEQLPEPGARRGFELRTATDQQRAQ